MKKFSQLFILYLSSLVLGLSVFAYTNSSVIKTIYPINSIKIVFSYLKQDNNFTIKSYNEQKEKTIESTRFYSITKKQANSDVELMESEILISFFDSFKTEFEFNGQDNLVFIQEIRVNDEVIDLNKFLQNVTSSQKFKIGTMPNVDGIFILLESPQVTFDVSSVLNLKTLDRKTLRQLDEDTPFLLCCYFAICVLTALAFIYTFRHIIIKLVFRTNKSLEEFLAFNRFSNSIIVISTIILSIILSYYFANNKIFFYGEKWENIYIFFQNYLPMLWLTFIPCIIALTLKNRLLKGLLCLLTIFSLLVIFIDNGILHLLGTRFNFGFGGKFEGDAVYILDFVNNYLYSKTGPLMLGSTLIALTFIIWVVFTKTQASKSTLKFVLCITILLSIWGIWPREPRELDYEFANVYQVNNISFYTSGSFNKEYSEDFPLRDNLDFKWQYGTGLNQQKNVILVLVESLGCNFTYMCGNGPAYMPNLEKIAARNTLYNNYFSEIPATSLSYLSMVKSVPVIQTNDSDQVSQSYRKKLHEQNDFVKAFRENGYKLKFISSTDLVFGMKTTVSESIYDEVIDANSDLFKNITKRYVFNSVTDEELFKKIVEQISRENGKFFYITKTASNHAPYSSPLGELNIEKAFEYTDLAISKFVKELENNNYFDNGILILVGDHHAWKVDNYSPNSSPSTYNKVPLIIIDGKNEGKIYNYQFSHASLGVMLQYLQLPRFKYNKFNFIPTNPNDHQEYIFGYDYKKSASVSILKGDKEAKILLSGDDSKVEPNGIFTIEEEQDILGFLGWFR